MAAGGKGASGERNAARQQFRGRNSSLTTHNSSCHDASLRSPGSDTINMDSTRFRPPSLAR